MASAWNHSCPRPGPGDPDQTVMPLYRVPQPKTFLWSCLSLRQQDKACTKTPPSALCLHVVAAGHLTLAGSRPNRMIDQEPWAQIGLLCGIAFPPSWLIAYLWAKRAGLRSSGFSPTVAAIISTPILVAVYSVVHYRGARQFYLTLLVPIFVILVPLLAIYLAVAARRGRLPSRALLCATVVCCLILQNLWLEFVLKDFH
jgi:hypothetical protein